MTGVVVMAAAVVRDGIRGPALALDVREHLVVVGCCVAAGSVLTVRAGLRTEAALLGALVAGALTIAGTLTSVTVLEDVPQAATGVRALVISVHGSLDGEACVVVQTGGDPWSWQERLLCRSQDDPGQVVTDVRWLGVDRLRVTFGDGSSVDPVIRG